MCSRLHGKVTKQADEYGVYVAQSIPRLALGGPGPALNQAA